MTTNGSTKEALPFLSSQERLNAYQIIIDGCSHIYSKNKLQLDKAKTVLEQLVPLTKKDPYFLAHLVSYALKNSKGKDLHVFLTYVAALSSADGTPFSPDSKYMKPNLRYLAAAALQQLDPKLAARVMEIANIKYAVKDQFNEARHFPTSLRTALEKYLTYRETNLEMVKGIKKAGLGNTLEVLYRGLHKAPTTDVAKILRWQQKNKKIKFDSALIDFKDLTDIQIAKKIQKEKLSVLGVLGALPRPMSPVVAVAILEQCTGNQAVILRKTFEDAGVLKDPEVLKLYEKKIKTAKTALDRAETLSQTASKEVKEAMANARAEVRQEETKGLGKIYLHIDFSGSMDAAIEFAKERGTIIAECINDPTNNFKWGLFGSRGMELALPAEFVKDAFKAILFPFGSPNGATDCFALYPNARKFGADVDIFVTDQEHNTGNLGEKIKEFHEQFPQYAKPRACVIVDFSHGYQTVQAAYEANNIPVAILKPDTLTQSALVVEAVKTAIKGPVQIIDEIMNTPLLSLPNWYFTI